MQPSLSAGVQSLQIIEAFDHFEMVYGWSELLREMDWKVTFHVSPKYRDELQAHFGAIDHLQFLGPQRGESWPRYLKQLRDSPTTLWIVTTVGRRPGWFYPMRTFKRLYFVLHDLNYYFEVRDVPPGIWVGIHSRFQEWLSHFRRKNIRRLLTYGSGFIYPTPTLQEFGAGYAPYPGKIHQQLPFAVPRTPLLMGMRKRDRLRIVIPGSVNTTTRDYGPLEIALRMVAKRQRIMLDIHFAGMVKDAEIVKQIRENVADVTGIHSADRLLNLEFYPSGLSHNHYEELMASADLLVAPLMRLVRIGGVWENVGTTKISGSFFDAVRFGKRLYVPTWYDPSVTALYHYGDAEDLAEQICEVASLDSIPPVHYPGFTREAARQLFSKLLKAAPTSG